MVSCRINELFLSIFLSLYENAHLNSLWVFSSSQVISWDIQQKLFVQWYSFPHCSLLTNYTFLSWRGVSSTKYYHSSLLLEVVIWEISNHWGITGNPLSVSKKVFDFLVNQVRLSLYYPIPAWSWTWSLSSNDPTVQAPNFPSPEGEVLDNQECSFAYSSVICQVNRYLLNWIKRFRV